MVQILLAAGKKAVEKWIEITHRVYKMENMPFSQHLQKKDFYLDLDQVD